MSFLGDRTSESRLVSAAELGLKPCTFVPPWILKTPGKQARFPPLVWLLNQDTFLIFFMGSLGKREVFAFACDSPLESVA